MSDSKQLASNIKNMNPKDDEPDRYQALLRWSDNSSTDNEDFKIAPLIWWDIKKHMDKSNNGSKSLRQYAVLGQETSPGLNKPYKPVLLNTDAPWSAFLCGSQGSGKSHTLSCMLENCLLDDAQIGKTPHPLAGLVLHYNGSHGSGVCEAAYLCSKVKTRVLVSASNYGNLKAKYEDMAKQCDGDIEVHELKISPEYLDTERIKTLMAVAKDGEAPPYIQTLVKIIRDIATANGGVGTFDYKAFKSELEEQVFSEQQNKPLQLRIDLLESFLDVQRDPHQSKKSGTTRPAKKSTPPQKPETSIPPALRTPDYLIGAPGSLLIVDLTDPVVDADMACVLFDTCLSIFLAQTSCGKIIALDEAHNYLIAENAAAKQFTGKLLKSIREQRHLGARIVIATQEPTLDTSLLDLCSITMVHRCTSPAWFEVLKKHVAGLYLSGVVGEEASRKVIDRELFGQIVALKLGESLLLCPTGAMRMEGEEVKRMLDKYVTLRTRKRVTADGGSTKVASDLRYT